MTDIWRHFGSSALLFLTLLFAEVRSPLNMPAQIRKEYVSEGGLSHYLVDIDIASNRGSIG